MITSRYKLINNVVGWVVFAIALVTYWLTLEPTASYWDCGEFIIQADKLEIGHPPGNPIFMLTARFFANFASDQQTVALMVNAMSGLLSALTILLLFWTITHLVRRLLVRDDNVSELSVGKYLSIMGSGVVGALAYAWSDTFWSSAVEAEVYAFSSFCTALVFWLILKWENRADDPHSDRWLILIAYIIGVSVGVHLLNLLCIPAIALVFAYKRFKNMNTLKSLGVLGVSFGIIVLVLYGMVPGMMKVAQSFELVMVNGFNMPFNSGTVAYALIAFGLMAWSLVELYRQRSATRIRISFFLAVCMSGMLAFTAHAWVWILMALGLALVVWGVFRRGLPLRQMSVIMWSVMMIFVGISSYALILIRSNADTPMNQSSPDNVFDLASYLNREQYGETPLFYGRTYQAGTQKVLLGYNNNIPVYRSNIKSGEIQYAKKVDGAALPQMSPDDKDELDAGNFKLSRRYGDAYLSTGHKVDVVTNPELNILFPRIYSDMPTHVTGYEQWVPELKEDEVTRMENTVDLMAVDENGNEVGELDLNAEPIQVGEGMYSFPNKRAFRPSQSQNLEYFFRYQLNHMYFRYFMWNFAGRQNDINNQGGDLDAGNWISGIPFIDNSRLGDQSLLPDDLGKNNRGHNVYYMLPLLLGLIGLLWQAFAGKKGVEQFWVVFFLFFMTGIAIIFYLNQTPYQPRERDYAYAGSFYAYAIWIGMGVAALWSIIVRLSGRKKHAAANTTADDEPTAAEPVSRHLGLWAGVAVCLAGICVPIQMVSQTWDDHDRSGRTAARDFAINFLESTEPNAIVFCNGDNDTFPLWYAQEVEGVRTDVRVINLSYLTSDWYASQFFMPAYNGAPVPFTVQPKDLAYNALAACYVDTSNRTPMNLLDALKAVYAGHGRDRYGYASFPTSVVWVPVNKDLMIERGYVTADEADKLVDKIEIDLSASPSYRSRGYLSAADVIMLDIIATNAAQGWKRPIYWCISVGNDYYMGLDPYQAISGIQLQLVPWKTTENTPLAERNVKLFNNTFLWGGADTQGRMPYYDETAGRMVTTIRQSMLRTAAQLYAEGEQLETAGNKAAARDKYTKAARTIDLMIARLPKEAYPYETQIFPEAASILTKTGDKLGDAGMKTRGLNLLKELLLNYAQYVVYKDNITGTFGENIALSYNTKTTPLRYWQFVEMYQNAGGDWPALVKANPILQKLNQQRLKQNWEEVKGYFDPNFSPQVQHINDIAAMVIRMQTMTPAEYAKASDQDRQVDSMFYHLVISPASYGFTADDVQKATMVEKVDRERSRRLYEQFTKVHPEQFAQ